MLKLKKLEITNDEPLCISFYGKLKKETDILNKPPYDFANRKENICCESPIEEMCFETKNEEKIDKIMFYFFENCDEGKSPQSLWETSKGLGYKSLLLDYKDEQEKFDDICDCLLAILNKNLEVERQYIASIEVAYPDNWHVVYESSK
ncbi:hypothetical protein [Peptoniphilus timonensis]|uniref:hypothetical protein n=1 Tax=Peptoniphilus timonensis TaxID=1268254 RepID=UPI0002DE5490|nr:hypothetical protein [Peptoniphilus timonensis]